ncbi:MAG: NAD(P)H-binding protein [Bacteriovoracaceae bacterium]|nr:NAD(P)H-binding protein [Bacteriovoracaceae bacterium]
MKIAIFGATGFVGTALTLKLLDLDHHIVALSRSPQDWPIQHKNLQVIEGDISDIHAIEKVLKGVECAYYLVHGLAENDEDFEYVEVNGATQFVHAAIKTKMRKVIYLGGLGPDSDLSPHLRSRQLVGEILGLIPGACLEFRASIVLGANSTSFEMIKALAQRLPVRPYAPWLDTQCQPIGVEDLMSYLVSALDVQLVGHNVIEIGAPDVHAYGELLDIVAKIDGITRPKFLLPTMDQRLFYPLIDLVLPEFADVGKKLFISLSHPTVVTDNKAEEVFPEIKPKSTLEAMEVAMKESSTTYPAVWEGDFWKEVKDHTVLSTRQGQQLLLEKLKMFTLPYQEKLLSKLPKRKKK